jgi:hypothetical protein
MNLRTIRTFPQLVRYLEDELDWPLEGHDVEDLTFDYEADELGLKPAEAAKVKAIRQLRPLDSKQPWGIFFIEFDRRKLPVVVLRRILSHLVVKKRASANKAHRAAWHAEDLLFISAFGPDDDDGREISFAHFHQEEGDMPTLRVLGWDGGDTKLKIDHLDTTLREKLHWPDGKESLDAWRARWSGVFRHRIGHVINTSDMLAEASRGTGCPPPTVWNKMFQPRFRRGSGDPSPGRKTETTQDESSRKALKLKRLPDYGPATKGVGWKIPLILSFS